MGASLLLDNPSHRQRVAADMSRSLSLKAPSRFRLTAAIGYTRGRWPHFQELIHVIATVSEAKQSRCRDKALDCRIATLFAVAIRDRARDVTSIRNLIAVDTTFYVAWACIILAPLIALVIYIALCRWCPTLGMPLTLGAVGLIALTAAAVYFRISFVRPEIDVYAFCAAYLAYCFLAFCTWSLKLKAIRFSVLSITLLPVVVIYSHMAAGGAMLLVFVIGDHLAAPIRVEEIEGGLICRVTNWGYAFSDTGYDVNAYKPLGPFMQKKVASLRVNETHPQLGREAATCSDILAFVR